MRLAAAYLWWTVLGCAVLHASNASAQEGSLVTSVAWSSDRQYIASGTDDGVVTCQEAASGKIVWKKQGLTKKILGIHFSSSRQAFLLVAWPAKVLLLDEKSGAIDLNLTIDLPDRDGEERSGLAISSYDDNSGILALSGTITPTIYLMNVGKVTNSAAPQVIALGRSIYWLHPPAIDPEKKTSAVMSITRPSVSDADSGMFAVGDTAAVLADFTLCNGAKTALAITRDGWLYRWNAANEDKVVYRRHIEPPIDPDARHAKSFPHAAHVGCAGESTGITTGTTKNYGGIQLWDTSSGILGDFQKSDPDKLIYVDAYSVALSSDARFAVADGEGAYNVWSLATGKLARVAQIPHSAEPGWEYRRVNFGFAKDTHLLAFPDGGLVYIADLDKNTVRCLGTDCPVITIVNKSETAPSK
jgi:WD40 repeat protein